MTRRLLVAVAAGLAFAAAACASGSAGGPARVRSAGTSGVSVKSPLVAAVASLCAAEKRSGKDPGSARRIFLDEAHEDLHTLAGRAEGKDRQAAARLLVAMEAVEAGVKPGTQPRRAAALLGTLIDEATGALGVIGLKAPACAA